VQVPREEEGHLLSVLADMRPHIVSCRWPALKSALCINLSATGQAASAVAGAAAESALWDSMARMAWAQGAAHGTDAAMRSSISVPLAELPAALTSVCARLAHWELPQGRSTDVAVTVYSKQPGVRLKAWDAMARTCMGCKGMVVESWRHEPHSLPDFCGATGCSLNALGVHIPGGSSWSIEQDHSKWGVCCDRPIVCFSDNNRAEPQAMRGGSLLCFSGEGAQGLFDWLNAALRVPQSNCPECPCSTQ
jgi:Deoxyribonuclease II